MVNSCLTGHTFEIYIYKKVLFQKINKLPSESSGIAATQGGGDSVASGPRSVSRDSVDGTPKK